MNSWYLEYQSASFPTGFPPIFQSSRRRVPEDCNIERILNAIIMSFLDISYDKLF
jgi:hypothetical protein